MRIPYLLCVVVLVLASGCSLNGQFVDAVDAAWSTIGPRYVEYVKSDVKLGEDDKVTRIRTAQLLTETIAEAQK